jgi:hypothetical protein
LQDCIVSPSPEALHCTATMQRHRSAKGCAALRLCNKFTNSSLASRMSRDYFYYHLILYRGPLPKSKLSGLLPGRVLVVSPEGALNLRCANGCRIHFTAPGAWPLATCSSATVAFSAFGCRHSPLECCATWTPCSLWFPTPNGVLPLGTFTLESRLASGLGALGRTMRMALRAVRSGVVAAAPIPFVGSLLSPKRRCCRRADNPGRRDRLRGLVGTGS